MRTFPCKLRYGNPDEFDGVVLFESEQVGEVVVSRESNYPVGYRASSWISAHSKKWIEYVPEEGDDGMSRHGFIINKVRPHVAICDFKPQYGPPDLSPKIRERLDKGEGYPIRIFSVDGKVMFEGRYIGSVDRRARDPLDLYGRTQGARRLTLLKPEGWHTIV